MKSVSILAACAIIGFITGCEQKSDNQGGSADTFYRSSSSSSSSRESTEPGNAASANKPADNTARNIRDRAGDTLTPEDQGGSDSDRNITRSIRRTIMQNDQLSADAKNVKIITVNGKVTLRGPVKNEREAKVIMDAAQSVAPTGAVDNKLEVKTTNQ
jgi:osmotically-inducible protein OsmY